jgi:hypothetical protein
VNPVPGEYELQLADRSQAHAVQRGLERASGGQVDVEVTEDSARQERNDLRPVLYGSDVVLLAIGLVNLLTTLLLGIRERVRDFAIFKVVGRRRARCWRRSRRAAPCSPDSRWSPASPSGFRSSMGSSCWAR